MTDINRASRPSPRSTIGSWVMKMIRFKHPRTTVIETGDASAALAGLTSVAAACVVAVVLWRRLASSIM